MKKAVIFFVIFCGLVIMVWIVGRITGTLQYYIVSTPANEPSFKKDETLFTSNLKKPSLYKFVTFTSKYEDSIVGQNIPDFKTGSHYLYRVCGVGGNTLEMKDGVLFVDGKNFDEELDLKKQYELGLKDFNAIIADEDKVNDGSYRPNTEAQDSILISFDQAQIKKYQSKLKLTPFIFKDTGNVFQWLDKSITWTTDNFGPLVIPNSCYFGMGDNRHNALDSRYTGFIKAADIKGVVLNK